MKITINQIASLTGKMVHRINKGSELAVSQGKTSKVQESYKGRRSVSTAYSVSLNALAYGMFSTGKSRFATTASGINYFYNFAFPRDFVHTVGDTGTISTDAGVTIPKDPFNAHRDGDGRIDTGLDVSITIPKAMSIAGNSHSHFVRYVDIKDAWDSDHPYFIEPSLGANHPKGAVADYARYAMSDPAFMIDYDSHLVTSKTIQDSTFNITLNGGWVVGAGGFGGFGGVFQDSGQYTVDYASGGGGGGQGLHPSLSAGGEGSQSAWSEYYHDKAILDFADGGDTANGFLLGGQGGRSGSFNKDILSQAGVNAANGGYGSLLGAGGGGARSGGAADIPGTNEKFGGHGGWGGSAFYFRSNVHAASALTGTTINITATSNSLVAGGGGGGAGGRNNNTGRNGGAVGVAGTSDGSGAYDARGGLGGAVLFWNTANVAASNSYTVTSAHGADTSNMKGRDLDLDL